MSDSKKLDYLLKYHENLIQRYKESGCPIQIKHKLIDLEKEIEKLIGLVELGR